MLFRRTNATATFLDLSKWSTKQVEDKCSGGPSLSLSLKLLFYNLTTTKHIRATPFKIHSPEISDAFSCFHVSGLRFFTF